MRIGQRYGLPLGAAVFYLAAVCQTSQRQQTMLVVTSHKDDVRLQTRVTDGAVLIEIFSESGIGHADFELAAGQTPKRIVMRFYLRGLEELRFAYGETVVTASVSSTGEHGIRQSMSRAGEKPVEAKTLASNSPFWMKVRVASRGKTPLREGYIEAETPEDFLQSGARQASIQWIDFYR
ncbi:MAG: hypothetical protein ONB46_13545 [candidate division KSB1 bacterium]|nr:hypothetical protein [candidate division KSB1 bacterium]MDZ7367530.1 hypothetical protein [candidate division KSB1 bacterium]MDZ7404912.1 hypothetical protein [candidate division KSB1 bacterium]